MKTEKAGASTQWTVLAEAQMEPGSKYASQRAKQSEVDTWRSTHPAAKWALAVPVHAWELIQLWDLIHPEKMIHPWKMVQP